MKALVSPRLATPLFTTPLMLLYLAAAFILSALGAVLFTFHEYRTPVARGFAFYDLAFIILAITAFAFVLWSYAVCGKLAKPLFQRIALAIAFVFLDFLLRINTVSQLVGLNERGILFSAHVFFISGMLVLHPFQAFGKNQTRITLALTALASLVLVSAVLYAFDANALHTNASHLFYDFVSTLLGFGAAALIYWSRNVFGRFFINFFKWTALGIVFLTLAHFLHIPPLTGLTTLTAGEDYFIKNSLNIFGIFLVTYAYWKTKQAIM